MVLNLYKVLLWLITVVSSFMVGRLWGKHRQSKEVVAACVSRSETDAEVESKSDEAVKRELSKWVRK